MVTSVDETLVQLNIKYASFAPAKIFVSFDSLSQFKTGPEAMQVLAVKPAYHCIMRTLAGLHAVI